MARDSKTMERDSKHFRDLIKDAMLNEKYLKSKTDINNFKDPYYCVLLEDGPSHCFRNSGSYGSSSSVLYFSPDNICAFYKLLPFIARYYKVTISLVENPDPLPF